MIADTEQTITFAEFELDRARRRLLRDGEPVVLYAKTFDLLDFWWSGTGSDAGEIVIEKHTVERIRNEPRFLGQRRRVGLRPL